MIYAIEGIDYVGKTTLFKALQKRYPAFYSVEYPNYQSDTGKVIRAYLDGKLDVRKEFIEQLLEANRGKTVDDLYGHEHSIIGRSTITGVAYRMATSYEGSIADPDYATMVIREFRLQAQRERVNHSTPLPDVIFYLDAEPDTVKHLREMDGVRAEDLREKRDIQIKVYRNFKIILDECKNMGITVHTIQPVVAGEKGPIRRALTVIENEVSALISN